MKFELVKSVELKDTVFNDLTYIRELSQVQDHFVILYMAEGSEFGSKVVLSCLNYNHGECDCCASYSLMSLKDTKSGRLWINSRPPLPICERR